MRRDMLVGGEWRGSGARTEVRSPYDGSVVGSVPAGDAESVRAAHAAAAAALVPARRPGQRERADVLDRARQGLLARREEFAACMVLEAGKPLTSARAEVDRAADTLLFSSIEARTLAGTVVPMAATTSGEGKCAYTVLRPKGVVTAITPFNFPLNLVCHKVAPAFAAGCPVVLKPSELTPLTALLLAEVLVDAGMPAGYLNVVTGMPADLGPGLTGSQGVAVVTFTGSGRVGRMLAEQHPHIPVLLELGSTAPVIVDETADIGLAAQRVAATAFSYAGQSCISVQRVYVNRAVHQEFTDLLQARTGELRVGDPADERTDVGPMITTQERDRVVAWVGEAVEQGAELLAGGEVNGDGTLQPTVLDSVEPSMKVSCDEVFGPVVSIRAVDGVGQAFELSNASRYGLQAGVFTNDYATVVRAAASLEFGGVLINESPSFRADQQPYGGLRESGNTREGPGVGGPGLLRRNPGRSPGTVTHH